MSRRKIKEGNAPSEGKGAPRCDPDLSQCAIMALILARSDDAPSWQGVDNK
jgi:hypothetical protein